MKFKKIIILFIALMYMGAMCMPEVVVALENSETLDYNYWIYGYNVSDHDDSEIDGKNIIEEFEKEYQMWLDSEIAYIYENEPEYFIEKLSDKYPDKVLTNPNFFDEYKEEYREDLVNFYLEHEYPSFNKWNFGEYYDGEWTYKVDEEDLTELTDIEKENIINEALTNYTNFYDNYFYNFWLYCLRFGGLEESLFESYNSDYNDFYIKAYQYKEFLTFKPEKLAKFEKMYRNEVFGEFISDNDGPYGQFNIHGLFNDDIFIGTTHDDYGYQTHLDFDGEEDYLGYVESLFDFNKNIKVSKDGIELYKSGKVKLTIKAENIDDKTVKVTHTLTNLKNKTVPYKLAVSSDVDLGNNDKAAVSKTNKSFVITQDSDETVYDYWGDEVYLSDTYGKQLFMTMSPTPTTTYVGPFGEESYKNHVFENSLRKNYTASDDENTALAYSWQGNLDKGETKTFTTIFGLSHTNIVDINFYPLKDDGTYGEPTSNSPISILGGMSFETPNTTHKVVKGYHSEWNTKKDGTGVSYPVASWVFAPNEDTNLYEVLVSNEDTKKDKDNISLLDIVNPDTGDRIYLYILIMICCLTVSGFSIYLYKNEN